MKHDFTEDFRLVNYYDNLLAFDCDITDKTFHALNEMIAALELQERNYERMMELLLDDPTLEYNDEYLEDTKYVCDLCELLTKLKIARDKNLDIVSDIYGN
ncbi:MAG: hypothetical protein HUJ63_05640 [Enterococcus sp.]|nr:hypothetical protein [Enterococcus sp.]